MGTRKELVKIQKQLQELQEFVKGDFDKQNNELKELKENLSNISLKIKKISPTLLDNGEQCVKVEYEAPIINLYFDEKGEIIYNPIFYSINILNLVSDEDFKKISKVLRNMPKTKK